MNSWTSPVDIRPDHLAIVQGILRVHLPAGFKVWVFGSRANWTTKDSSDLDLAVEGADALDYKAMVGLQVAFEESDLPYTVDVVDLNAVSPEFKNIVEAQRIPLPPAAPRKVSSEWRKVTLGELTENFDAIRVPVKESDRKPGPYPYYGASGVVDRVDGFLFDGQYLLIAEDGENLRTRATPIAFLADGRFWVNNHAHIVRGNHHADTRFLNYALSNLDISGYLTGSTMPKLTQRNMNQILLTVPPLPEQRRIAHILGTLDDKIELNRGMNQTLEAMARAISQDWFVDFGPTRAKMEGQEPYLPPELWDLFPDELADSELGEIPEGWIVGELREIADFPVRTVKPQELPEETAYIGLEHMPRKSITLGDWGTGERVTSNKLSFQRGDFLFGKLRPYFHKVGMTALSGICSTDIVVVSPKRSEWSSFVLLCISSEEFVSYTDQTSNGTKMPRTNWKTMSQYEICRPPDPVAQAFQSASEKILSRINANIHESRTLSQQRDTLLPRMFSGEDFGEEGETPHAL